MSEFHLGRFLEEELAYRGELYDEVTIETVKGEDRIEEHSVFDEFTFEVGSPLQIGAAADRVDLIAPGGKRFSILERLPMAFKFKYTFYPTGSINFRTQEITSPRVKTKGGLASMFHEVGHARRYHAMPETEQRRYIEALRRTHGGGQTQEDKDIVIGDEREAWRQALEILKRASEELQLELIRDRAMLGQYIERRILTYETHL